MTGGTGSRRWLNLGSMAELRLALLRPRFAYCAAGASFLLFGLSLGSFLVWGPRQAVRSAGTELQSITNVAAERILTKDLEAVGGEDCHPTTYRVTRASFWVVPTRAIADVACEAAGSGAQYLTGFQFTGSDLAEWETMYSDYLASLNEEVPCEGVAGESPWSDAQNKIRGKIYCAESSGNMPQIAWSDDATKIAYVISSGQNNMGSLFDWWQAHVRNGLSTTAGTRLLDHLYSPDIKGGLSSCRSSRSPIATLAMHCVPVRSAADATHWADSLTLYYFATSQQLNAFYQGYEMQFDAPSTTGEAFCGAAPLVATTYGEPTDGRVFCFSADAGPVGAMWLLWTHDSQHVAGLLERKDQNQQALVQIWEDLY
jgi:hypothetical protein